MKFTKKELSNINRLCDSLSVKDSKIKDSTAYKIFQEIKSAYPQVKLERVISRKNRDGILVSELYLGNMPRDEHFKKFLKYLIFKKYNFTIFTASIGSDSITFYEE